MSNKDEIQTPQTQAPCRCSNCGHQEPPLLGVPCYTRTCPKCGAPMS